MATMTAQILVGSPHPNHDGINPTHYLFLSENSRPAWILVLANVFHPSSRKKIIWIPTVENMLEDAFLMIAVHIQQDQEIIELTKSLYKNISLDKLELYDCVDRNQLYEKCRQLNLPKIIISVFKDSTIQGQLEIIEQYKMDVEVCRLTYSRLFSRWSEKTTIDCVTRVGLL